MDALVAMQAFLPLLSGIADELLIAVPNSRVLRLGLRYVNVFTSRLAFSISLGACKQACLIPDEIEAIPC